MCYHPDTGGWAAEQDRNKAVTDAANAAAAQASLNSTGISPNSYDSPSSQTYNDSGNSFTPNRTPSEGTYSSSSSSWNRSGGEYSGGGHSRGGGAAAEYYARIARGQAEIAARPKRATTFSEDLAAFRKSVGEVVHVILHPISSLRTSRKSRADERRRRREWTEYVAKCRATNPEHADNLVRIWGP
jgi:hypothetical protein